MKTKTFLKRTLMNVKVSLFCLKNFDHIWTNEGGVFKFSGSWDRGKIKGTLFDKEIQEMAMPKAWDLNDYTDKELAIKKGVAYCPLCLKEGKGKHELCLISQED